ncbi:MAG: hypothetical protein M1570_18630 [Chloroflexi bacterium]|nr:hypothetical protein [Chloroflexota bacterium]
MPRQPKPPVPPTRFYSVDCGPGDEIQDKDGKVHIVVRVIGKTFVITRETGTGRVLAWAADSPETDAYWAHYRVLNVRRVK